ITMGEVHSGTLLFSTWHLGGVLGTGEGGPAGGICHHNRAAHREFHTRAQKKRSTSAESEPPCGMKVAAGVCACLRRRLARRARGARRAWGASVADAPYAMAHGETPRAPRSLSGPLSMAFKSANTSSSAGNGECSSTAP